VKKLKLSFLLLVVVSMAVLATFAAPVQAGFIGDVPIIPFTKDSTDPDLLVGVGIENLWINKGLVKLGENDRAIMVASAKAIDPKDSGVVASVDPKDNPTTPDVKAELEKGAYVKVLPILLEVPLAEGLKMRPYLAEGRLLLCEVTVHLVLVYGTGERRIMDTVVVTVEVNPPPAPTPT
jgi:hypothetical protein